MKKLFLVLLTPFVLNAQFQDTPYFKIVCPVPGWDDTTMTYTNTGDDKYGLTTLSACMKGRFNSCGYWKGVMISKNVFQFHTSEYSTTRINLRTKEETNILINKSKTFPIAHKGNQTFYIVTKWNGVGGVKISFEHDEYEWIDLKTELDDYQCGPNYQKVLEYIAKLL